MTTIGNVEHEIKRLYAEWRRLWCHCAGVRVWRVEPRFAAARILLGAVQKGTLNLRPAYCIPVIRRLGLTQPCFQRFLSMLTEYCATQ